MAQNRVALPWWAHTIPVSLIFSAAITTIITLDAWLVILGSAAGLVMEAGMQQVARRPWLALVLVIAGTLVAGIGLTRAVGDLTGLGLIR